MGAEGAGLYLELARTAGAVHDVVRSGRRIVLVVGQIRAVEQKDVVVGAGSGDVDLCSVAAVRCHRRALQLGNSRLQQDQV